MQTIVAYIGKALQAVSKPLNWLKDGYLKAVNWVAAHPHKTIWASVGAIVVLAVL